MRLVGSPKSIVPAMVAARATSSRTMSLDITRLDVDLACDYLTIRQRFGRGRRFSENDLRLAGHMQRLWSGTHAL